MSETVVRKETITFPATLNDLFNRREPISGTPFTGGYVFSESRGRTEAIYTQTILPNADQTEVRTESTSHTN